MTIALDDGQIAAVTDAQRRVLVALCAPFRDSDRFAAARRPTSRSPTSCSSASRRSRPICASSTGVSVSKRCRRARNARGSSNGPCRWGSTRRSAAERRPRLARELSRRGEAIVRPLGHRARDDRVERRTIGRDIGHAWHRLVEVRDAASPVAISRGKGSAPGQRAVQHAAERVDVGARRRLGALGSARARRSRACRGTCPVRVSADRSRDRCGRARSRSGRRGRIGLRSIRTLAGLTSRCTRPARVRRVERARRPGRRCATRARGRQRARRAQQRLEVDAVDVAHRDEAAARRPRPRRRSGSRWGARSTRRGATRARSARGTRRRRRSSGAISFSATCARARVRRAVDDAHPAAAGDRLRCGSRRSPPSVRARSSRRPRAPRRRPAGRTRRTARVAVAMLAVRRRGSRAHERQTLGQDAGE